MGCRTVNLQSKLYKRSGRINVRETEKNDLKTFFKTQGKTPRITSLLLIYHFVSLKGYIKASVTQRQKLGGMPSTQAAFMHGFTSCCFMLRY